MTLNDIDPPIDETTKSLARVFDASWERFMQREGTQAGTDENRKRLADRIVKLAKSGESDEAMLIETTVIYLCVAAEAARIGQRNRKEAYGIAARLDEYGTQAFSPETVAAMSTALDLCRNELPFRLSSDVLQVLSTSILDAASRGEHDPDRLHRQALDALKARQ